MSNPSENSGSLEKLIHELSVRPNQPIARQQIDDVSNIEYLHVSQGNLAKLADSRFDFICCLLVLQHQPEHSIVALYIQRLVSLLAPGGLLVFQLPGRVGWAHRLQIRRRLYRALRQRGCQPAVLYRLGLFPISMLAASQEWVRAEVEKSNGQVLRVEAEQPGRASDTSNLYFVVKR